VKKKNNQSLGKIVFHIIYNIKHEEIYKQNKRFINKIICGDCLEVMKEIPPNSIDLIVTSPPYNIGINYGVYKDNISWEDYLKWSRKWLRMCYILLKDDGRICINHYINFRDLNKISRFPIMDIRSIQEEIGFNVYKLIVWEEKTKSCLTAWGSWKSASAPYIQTPYEGILISYKNQWKKKTKGVDTISKENFIKGVSGVWNLGTNKNKEVPATFPIALPKLAIELLSFKNDIILDPFGGSGQTSMAAKATGRRYIGIELNPKFCKIARDRLKEK